MWFITLNSSPQMSLNLRESDAFHLLHFKSVGLLIKSSFLPAYSAHRSRGRQRKTWMDNVREDLKEKNIDLIRIGEATRNREVWRNLVRASSSAR